MTYFVKQQLELLARYHGWATYRLLSAIADLSEDIYRRDTGLVFRSIHGTLNHLLVTDAELWHPRFAKGSSPAVALDAEIETNRERLSQSLIHSANQWSALVSQLSEAQLQGQLSYLSTQGEERHLPYAATLLHFFNHGTHHRGQVTAAISAAGKPFPPLDLLVLIGEEARDAAGISLKQV